MSMALLVTVLVFRSKTAFLELPHVICTVSSFLDSSVDLSLQQACAFHSLALLDRIWNSSDVYGIRNNVTDGTWTLRRFLRTDKYYRQHLFTLCMQEAVAGQDLELVKWLSIHFQGATVTFDTVAKACQAGAMEILELFKENDRFSLEETDTGLDIEWGGLAMSAAVLGGYSDLVQWLPEPSSHSFYDMETALKSAVKMGVISTAEWLGKRVERWPESTDDSVLSLAAEGRLDVLQWLETRGIVSQRVDGIVLLVVAAAENGHLKLVRWLMDSVLKRRSSIKQTCIAAGVATFSIHAAAAHGHLTVARFLHVLTRALVNGQVIEIMSRTKINSFQRLFWQQLDHPKYKICKVSAETMVKAVENGFLGVVQWLVEVYSGDPINRFQYKMRQGLICVLSMDVAAINGQLHVLRYLHSLQTSGVSGLECTLCAMDGAAANDHLEVVKWLHVNRHEGCSSSAMDKAAASGHLDIVKWLHENRREGCTESAMNTAALNGHLEVVKWLHCNRSEGCTAQAMDGAAQAGHLDVVKWLHQHRTEGCSTSAMDGAAESGALNVVKWLHTNRFEGCTTRAMDGAAEKGHLKVVQWLHANRFEGCSSRALFAAAVSNHFEVVMFLHFQCHAECSEEIAHELVERNNYDMYKWILQHYPDIPDIIPGDWPMRYYE
ncbi:putative ankyrin repeat protein [Phytophthora citrophthora]|uniref:Ankyrin repeat protein n=1 Tax=Phytophthora citrophthora TaxID=4793 RepID=A0AAD9GLT8_9STRA|nr:putative ankyrin repeat protein [Phytophthora citrophthora]